MKKKEILHLINKINKMNNFIMNNSRLLTITRPFSDESMWFPNIPELKDEFAILKEEIKEVKSNVDKQKEILEETKNHCNHEIRLEYYGDIVSSYKCAICGKTIHPDNYFSWGDSINRNRHCVILPAKEQIDEDGFSYELNNGYRKEQIISIILEILNYKNDEDEIDLIDEFKKLNLPNSKIIDKKLIPEYYILIIDGSNHEHIGNNAYIYTPIYIPAVNFLKYFKNLLNIKIEFIASNDILDSYECTKIRNENDGSIQFSEYHTLEELKELIKISSKIPYKLVINASNLSTYKIVKSRIIRQKYNLNLCELFPNSHIIEIADIHSIKNTSELKKIFESFKTPNDLYFCSDGENSNTYYYSLENEKLVKESLDQTCDKIKRKLKK